jgi:hypothetical protein
MPATLSLSHILCMLCGGMVLSAGMKLALAQLARWVAGMAEVSCQQFKRGPGVARVREWAGGLSSGLNFVCVRLLKGVRGRSGTLGFACCCSWEGSDFALECA